MWNLVRPASRIRRQRLTADAAVVILQVGGKSDFAAVSCEGLRPHAFVRPSPCSSQWSITARDGGD